MIEQLYGRLRSIKLIVTDIHGTLKPSEEYVAKIAEKKEKTPEEIQNEILKENISVLKELRSKGIITAAVTGGDFADAQYVETQYIGVAYGGGLLERDDKGEYIVKGKTPLDWNACCNIISGIESDSNLTYHLSTPMLFLAKKDIYSTWKRFYGNGGYNKDNIQKCDNLESYKDDVIRICVSFGKGKNGEDARTRFIQEHLKEHKKLAWIARTTVGMSKEDAEIVLDIIPESITKETTMKEICELQEQKDNIIKSGQTLMLGDSGGDRGAIINAGIGVCMQTADLKFKQSLPTSTRYTGTVAQILRRLFLKPKSQEDTPRNALMERRNAFPER